MIEVTKLNGRGYYINPHLIESIESKPDTIITVMPSKILVVKESVDIIIKRIVAYRRSVGIGFSDSELNEYALGEGEHSE